MGKQGQKDAYKAEEFIKAIPGSGGIITTIARRVGCNWDTAKKYINLMPEVNQAYENERESMLDIAEETLLNSIKGGDTADAKWVLTKLGKHRGYGDVVKVDTWQSDIIQAIQDGTVDPEDIRRDFPEIASNLFLKVGKL